jgi:hypothetical protein
MSKPIVIAEREASSMASTWNEYLCLTKGESNTFKLYTAQYDFLAELYDFYDEELHEYVLPEQIDGQVVMGIEDDYVVGGDLVPQDESIPVEFASVFDSELRDWLTQTGWLKFDVLAKIEVATKSVN